MPVFPLLEPASFGGIAFPIKSASVKGGIRDHVHEYPHAPGGAGEKLGRKLYEVEMMPIFDSRLSGTDWPDNWPANLGKLVAMFEKQTTEALVIPIIGSIQAYATVWDQNMRQGKLSGPDVMFHFREDQRSAFLTDGIINVINGNLRSLSDELIYQAKRDQILLDLPLIIAPDSPATADLFSSIKGLVDGVLAYGDQIEAADNAFAAKVEGLVAACEQADHLVEVLQPKNCRTMGALHDLWAASIELNKDVLKRLIPVIPFTVPRAMTVADIASLLYGSAARSSDILRMNAFPDPFHIDAGTKCKVFAK